MAVSCVAVYATRYRCIDLYMLRPYCRKSDIIKPSVFSDCLGYLQLRCCPSPGFLSCIGEHDDSWFQIRSLQTGH